MLFWNVKDGKENIFDLDVFFLSILVQKDICDETVSEFLFLTFLCEQTFRNNDTYSQ